MKHQHEQNESLLDVLKSCIAAHGYEATEASLQTLKPQIPPKCGDDEYWNGSECVKKNDPVG
jgi:hypothetical protein